MTSLIELLEVPNFDTSKVEIESSDAITVGASFTHNLYLRRPGVTIFTEIIMLIRTFNDRNLIKDLIKTKKIKSCE